MTSRVHTLYKSRHAIFNEMLRFQSVLADLILPSDLRFSSGAVEVILEFFDLEHLLYTLQQKFIDDNNPHGLNLQK